MMELMIRGGPMMWIILVCSAVGVSVFFERFFHLHRAQINAPDFLHGVFNILRKKNYAEAISICEETPGPIAAVVKAAILARDENKENIAQTIHDAGLAEVPRLEGSLIVLATIGYITPLLGFLGTVQGLMQALLNFQRHAPLVESGDLFTGLWRALITTAAGLAVAIPAYAGYNFLVHRVESLLLDMEKSYYEILQFLMREHKETPEGGV